MTELKQANKSSVFVLDWAAVAASGVVNEFFALARNLPPTEGRTVVLSYLMQSPRLDELRTLYSRVGRYFRLRDALHNCPCSLGPNQLLHLIGRVVIV